MAACGETQGVQERDLGGCGAGGTGWERRWNCGDGGREGMQYGKVRESGRSGGFGLFRLVEKPTGFG
jgi:hypothetical protein